MKPKPVPPEDLWAQIEKDRLIVAAPTKPEGGFTLNDYMKRFSLSKDVARAELKRLASIGKVKVYPGRGNRFYPTFYVRCSQK